MGVDNYDKRGYMALNFYPPGTWQSEAPYYAPDPAKIAPAVKPRIRVKAVSRKVEG